VRRFILFLCALLAAGTIQFAAPFTGPRTASAETDVVVIPAEGVEAPDGTADDAPALPELADSADSSGSAGSSASAASPDAGKRVAIFSDDRVVSGINHTIDVYFEISKNKRSLEASYLELSFGHSPVLIAELSFLTVLMDDVPISSIPLDETNAEQSVVRIPLSSVTLGPGYHKLSFRIQMNSTLIACSNPDSPANWIVIYKTSHMNLHLADISLDPDLAIYPSPFYETGDPDMQQTVIVVPDAPVHEELAAVTKLVQFFSRQNVSARIPFAVYPESEVTASLEASHHVIWIGLADRWTSRGRDAVDRMRENGLPESWSGGFIGLMRSPVNSPYMQLFLIGNGRELANGAQILSDSALYSQLRGTYSLLTEKPLATETFAETATGSAVNVTFAQMGYGNIVMENTLVGHAQIYYTLPGNWDFSGEGRLELNYTHSTSVNLNESVIAVKVNGVPVASKYLRQSDGNRGRVEIELSRELLSQRRTLEIDVQVEFITAAKHLDEAVEECSDISFMGHWAVIDPGSSLTFTPVERRQFNLQSIPFPFIVNGRWTDTTVVTAGRPDRERLSMLMTLIGIMGRDARDNDGLQFLSMSEFSAEELAGRNLIIISSAEELPPGLSDFPQSKVRFADNRVLSRTDLVELLDELQRQSVVMQLSHSPYHEQASVLQITVTDGGRLDMITRTLVDPEQYFAISGQFVIVDIRDRVHTFPESAGQNLERVDDVDEETFLVLTAVFLALFLAILLALVLFIRRMLKH
jgi:hypothetical protein